MTTWASPGWLVAAFVTVAAGTLVGTTSRSCARQRHEAKTGTRGVAWEWFCFTNVCFMGIFVASVYHLLSLHGAFNFTDPSFLAAVVCAVGSLLYLFAFFGIAFIYEDVDDSLTPRTRKYAATSGEGGSAGTATPPATAPRPLRPEYDADVVVVGAGTAGAALATVLARDGKRVVVIERNMNVVDRIVGELMQPGGVRSLERMGLGDCAKDAVIDPVRVDGYVCMTPGGGPNRDLVLTYPESDPASLAQYCGCLSTDRRAVKRHAAYVGGGEPMGGAATSPMPAGEVEAGMDTRPTGRSFHNHRFVHQLRLAALAERNVTLHLGRVTGMLTAGELGLVGGASAATATGLQTKRPAVVPAPVFAGYDDAGVSKGSMPPTLDAAGCGGVKPSAAAHPGADGGWPPLHTEPDTVSGVTWVDEWGVEHVVSARLTVIADGMYSVMRRNLHVNEPRTVSHFCGLLLHHPPHATPLPYPNRGHVLLADPNPILLYQISATETRVLVDVPGKLPSVEDGSLRAYFLDVVAPQMPDVVRPYFIEAVNTQEAQCMPNKSLVAAPTQRRGAVLLGDSWNMRHPLTGGGMTVALKDVEMLANALQPLDLQTASWRALDDAIARFQTRRSSHASTINILANALYRVFSKPVSDDGTRGRLRAACVDYLSMGGASTAGPVGLLSGLTPKPAILVTHFFAVALHAMKLSVLPVPTPTRLRQGYDLLHIACIIIMPLLAAEQVTILSWPIMQSVIDTIFPWRNVDPATL